MSTWGYCDDIWRYYMDVRDGYVYGVDEYGYSYPAYKQAPLEENR
jgi:hypothetical protein